ncbi:hypothetical protein BKA57DRAFT_461883 [Linnemannia elongata]|nr:hypothetical protein BKA57DRAFT_461883 [Linnemannia elongata]
MVMVLHRPILMNANLAANRRHQGRCDCSGSGSGSGSGDGGKRVSMAVTTAAGAPTAKASGDVDMVSRSQSEEVEDEAVDDEDEGEDKMDKMDTESQIEDSSKDDVRKKLRGGGGGGGGKSERDRNGYDSDDAEDLQIIERSMQRCTEAAHAVIAIVRNFDDTLTKYHGGHHTVTVYLAGTILIMQLSKTEDPAVQRDIYEGIEVCFRFFSILSPYWKETDEKAKVLRDLLSSHVKKNKQQGPDDIDGDDDDQDEEGDDDDDGGDNESGGGALEDDEGGDYSANDDGGAEQSLQDLMIADALLDLSSRPPREDYEWRGTASRSMPLSSQKAKAAASASSLPSTSPSPRPPPPPLRHSRSGSSLSEYRRQRSGNHLLSPVSVTATTASQRRTTVPQYPSLPSASLQRTTEHSRHFATTTNYTINFAITSTTTTTMTSTITTTATSITTDPTATIPMRFEDRVGRRQEEEGSVAGAERRKHTVSTEVSTFFKVDKTRIIPPPPPPETSLHHHHNHKHNHNHRQTTTWVGGGAYPDCNSLDETTLISLEKLCLSIEPPF